jgi:DNA-binding PadR family transcriptional regulator
VPPAPDLDLIRGTLDLLLLKTLSWGPMHGLAALQWIERTTNQKLQVEEGALYPALHRLEEKGWLADAERSSTDSLQPDDDSSPQSCPSGRTTPRPSDW